MRALFSHAGPSAEGDAIHTLDNVQFARIGRWERETELELTCRGYRSRTKTEGTMELLTSFKMFLFLKFHLWSLIMKRPGRAF